MLGEIPNGSAAALVLLEHHWAVGLQDAVARAGGYWVSDGFISPLDLIALGMLSAAEAAEMHKAETATPRPPEPADDNGTGGEDSMFGSRRVARRTARRTARRVDRRH